MRFDIVGPPQQRVEFQLLSLFNIKSQSTILDTISP